MPQCNHNWFLYIVFAMVCIATIPSYTDILLIVVTVVFHNLIYNVFQLRPDHAKSCVLQSVLGKNIDIFEIFSVEDKL